MRIDKLLSHSGYGTRKQVRQMIKKGFVQVDGRTVRQAGYKINPDIADITVKGERVRYERFVYLMLNKPKGYVSATYDAVHSTVLDLVPLSYRHYKLAPVGRLDIDTEGFILLTNDGQLNHLITSPKQNITKTYEAWVLGSVEENHIARFAQGVKLEDGYLTKPAKLEVLEKEEHRTYIRLSITEGKFHQVKRMFRAIECPVVYLKRTKIGELSLDNQLELGAIRPLNEEEMDWIERIKEGE